MPNHTANQLKCVGPFNKILELIAFVSTPPAEGETKGSNFSLNKIIPMPESLHITSGGTVNLGIAIIKLLEENDPTLFKEDWAYKRAEDPSLRNASLEVLKSFARTVVADKHVDLEESRKAIKNRELYGYQDWYGWACDNWDTKWDAYDVGEWTYVQNMDNDAESTGTLYFETAWSPPIKVIQALAQKFPELELTLHYSDEGGGFVGYSTFHGEEYEEFAKEWDSEEGKEILQLLGRYYEDEDEDEEENDDLEDDLADDAGEPSDLLDEVSQIKTE